MTINTEYFEQLSATASAVSPTVASLPSPVESALIIPDDDGYGFRYRTDGTDPTSSVGVPNSGYKDDYIIINGRRDVERFRAIRTGSNSATLNVTYFNEEITAASLGIRR